MNGLLWLEFVLPFGGGILDNASRSMLLPRLLPGEGGKVGEGVEKASTANDFGSNFAFCKNGVLRALRTGDFPRLTLGGGKDFIGEPKGGVGAALECVIEEAALFEGTERRILAGIPSSLILPLSPLRFG